MVVPGEMKVKAEEERDAGASSVQLANHQHNHLPILKGILDGVVEYHNAPVRFGRVPKREKARILAAMHQSCQSRSAERAAVAEQLNGVGANQVDGAAVAVASPSADGQPSVAQAVGQPQQQHGAGAQPQPQHQHGGGAQHGTGAQQHGAVAQQQQHGVGGAQAQQHGVGAQQESVKEEGGDWSPEEAEGELEATRLAQTVLRAHSDTCHFAHLRPKEGACPRAGGGPVYSVPGRNGPILACPLNPRRPLVAGLTPDSSGGRGEDTLLQDFSQRFSPAIRGVVEFAKRIPGFALLSQSDQVTLLKAGVFEVLLLRLACLFDAQSNTMTCLNGELLRRESIVTSSPPSSPPSAATPSANNARFLVDSMFEFATRLNALHLSDAELALFSAVVIIAPDRPGLRHTDLISRIHSRLMSSLSLLLHSHSGNNAGGNSGASALMATLQSYIPDLRTLNTLHSEKLLAFKMTEQQQQQQQHQHQGPDCPAPQVAAGGDQCKQYATLRQSMPETMACRQQATCSRVAQGMHVGQQVVLSQCPRQQQLHSSSMVDDPSSMEAVLHQHQAPAWKEAEEDEDVQEVMEEEDQWQRASHHLHHHHPSANMRTNSTSSGAVVSGLKSPLGSVSSSESVCSGEVASLSEFRGVATASAPLLAASLSGAALNGASKRRRHRDRSESNSEEDTQSCGVMHGSSNGTSGASGPHHQHHQGTGSTNGVVQATQMTAHRTTYFRKLDSPSDSGIESGTERLEKSSTSTSVCSSPRSSLEDKEDNNNILQHSTKVGAIQRGGSTSRCPHLADRPVEDMPVLKRVLQAPPLYDTNSLMDEAYKPHKKFRALRKDCAEAEALEGPNRAPQPPLVVLSPPQTPASPHTIISTLNIHLPQITIHAQPMHQHHHQGTSPPAAQMGNSSGSTSAAATNNPPLLLQKALLQPPANQRSLQSHQHQALLSALSADPGAPALASAGPSLNSSLSSTHSTLARSLMEGPKMTAEQMKRTDIIHSYIMRGEGEEEDLYHQHHCSGNNKATQQQQQQAQQQSPYRIAKETVAMATAQGHELPSNNSSSSGDDPSYRSAKAISSQGYVRGKEQTPGVLVFNGSYLSHVGSWDKCASQQQQQPQGVAEVVGYSPVPSPVKQETKQGGQPLNLSKKTPPPSPATTPVMSASIMEA